MSYQLEQELGKKGDKKADIAMPPLANEQPQPKSNYEIHPELQNALPHEAQQVEEQPEQVEEVEQQAPKQTQESPQAKNFRELNEQKRWVERERDELYRKVYDLENSRKQEPLPKEEEDINVGSDDIVEGKHLSKYDRKIKVLQDKLDRAEQQSNLTSTEVRLRSQYPDFDKVVSKDNIEILRNSYPELADTLNNSTTNLYSKAVSAYTLIKKLGITSEDVYMEDKQKAKINSAKPRPLTSVNPQQGDSPLSRANAFANGLTDELKKQLRKEMADAIK